MDIEFENALPFRPDLFTYHPEIQRLSKIFIESIDKKRRRRLTNEQFDRHQICMAAVMLNIFASLDANSGGWVRYSRKKDSYKRGGQYWSENEKTTLFGLDVLDTVLNSLESKRLIEHVLAQAGYSSHSSRFRPTSFLRGMITSIGLNWAHLKTRPKAFSILVRDKSKKSISFPDEEFDHHSAQERLGRINENLQDSFLNLHVSDSDFDQIQRSSELKKDGADTEPVDEAEYGLKRQLIDFSDRKLRRIFSNGTFNDGGRFYGGWWQRVPSKYRLHIEIEGQLTSELDFSCMQPTILYAMAKEEPPEDAYSLEGWDSSLRPVIKKAFSQLINCAESTRNPNQWHRLAPTFDNFVLSDEWVGKNENELRKLFRAKFKDEQGRDYSELLDDLLKFHKPIARFFFSSAWTWTQRMDSDIAELTMIKLLDNPVPVTALPIHDSFLVRRGKTELTKSLMMESFQEIVGGRAKIDVDDIYSKTIERGVKSSLLVSSDIHSESKLEMKTHSKSHIRFEQWRSVHGLNGYE